MTARQQTVALLAEIKAFCEGRGLKRTWFGQAVMHDPRFVFDLERGRTLRPVSVERVKAYLTRYG